MKQSWHPVASIRAFQRECFAGWQGVVPAHHAPYVEIRPAVLGVKMEYLEEFGVEMLQPDELSSWWAASSLSSPETCDVVVSLHATPLSQTVLAYFGCACRNS